VEVDFEINEAGYVTLVKPAQNNSTEK